jgi:hypothetical protein
VQSEAPTALANVPAKHETQVPLVVAPTDELNCPIEQLTQVDEPAMVEYVPGAHATH